MDIFILLSIITITLSIMLAWYIRKYLNKEKKYTNFIFLMLAVSVWSIFAALEVISKSRFFNILFSQFAYFGIVSVPVFWLFFSMEYKENHKWLKKKQIRLFWIIPVITVLLVFTNDLHGLVWTRIYFEGIFNGIYVYKFERGIWFLVNSIYIYSLLLAGLVIIFLRLKETGKLKNYFPVILGVSAPLITNYFYITRALVYDYTPEAFSFTCICLAWAIISGFLERRMAINETIHESMEEGIILIDEKYLITSINPCAQKIIHKHELPEDCRADEVIFFWDKLKDKLVNDANEYFEICFNMDDETKWYGIHLYSISKKSNISGWILSLFDITEKKYKEEELRRLDNEARKAAEDANNAKGFFLANMSHEIRTPMNGIIGFIDVLSQTKMTREQYDYLNEIRNASDALLYLINDVLDFSKIEADKMELEYIDFNIHNVVESSITLISPNAFNKGIVLHSEIKAGVPSIVRGDPGRFRQILNNLLSNALKFTHEGEITVTVECLNDANNRVLLRFRVADTGIGMTEEVISNIFTPFTQADTSTTRKYGGTGLGLAICKRIIEKMNGTISVESRPNQGTIFMFEIGFEKGAEIERMNYAEICGIKVLISDDNRTNRRIFREYLEGTGCIVLEAKNGYETMEVLSLHQSDKPVDIAVIDFNMPDINGFTLGDMILKANMQAKPKIILASSVTQIGDGKRANDMGFSGYLPKPIKKKELLDTISAVAGCNVQSELQVLVTRHLIMEDAVKEKKKILLAEDTEANRKLASIMLKKIGYDCEVVINGQEAVEACIKKKYDVILMDCQMPVMDGYEATGRIKLEGGFNQKTPIIAMTANALDGDREKCLMAGMDDYISKPINLKILESMLEKWTT